MFYPSSTLISGDKHLDAEISPINRGSTTFNMSIGRAVLNHLYAVDPYKSYLMGKSDLEISS